MKNLKEFVELIHRYETVTLEEIKSNWDSDLSSFNCINSITGFGSLHTCTLCNAVNSKWDKLTCEICVYHDKFGCSHGVMESSYDAISESETPEDILKAFRNRAVAMRQFAANNNIDISKFTIVNGKAVLIHKGNADES